MLRIASITQPIVWLAAVLCVVGCGEAERMPKRNEAGEVAPTSAEHTADVSPAPESAKPLQRDDVLAAMAAGASLADAVAVRANSQPEDDGADSGYARLLSDVVRAALGPNGELPASELFRMFDFVSAEESRLAPQLLPTPRHVFLQTMFDLLRAATPETTGSVAWLDRRRLFRDRTLAHVRRLREPLEPDDESTTHKYMDASYPPWPEGVSRARHGSDPDRIADPALREEAKRLAAEWKARRLRRLEQSQLQDELRSPTIFSHAAKTADLYASRPERVEELAEFATTGVFEEPALGYIEATLTRIAAAVAAQGDGR